MRFTIYIYVALLFVLYGCDKEWFDVKSNKQLAVPETIEELQAILDDALIMNYYSPIMGENAMDLHYYSDRNISRLSDFERNSYTWSKDAQYRNVPDWLSSINRGSYRKIYISNLVLEGVDKLKPFNEDEKMAIANVKGQALFFRGKTYFELAEIFVPPYEEAILNQKLGIPLRLESDISIKSTRSTIGETYDRIIKDLDEATTLLSENQDYKTRPNRKSAFAQLSRVYLSMRKYKEAMNSANIVLSSNPTLLNYNDLNLSTNQNPFSPYNIETIFYNTMGGGLRFSVTGILIKKEFYDSYSSNDLRKTAFFNFDNASELVTYKGTYAGLGYFNFFNGLATDEFYLIRAECYARTGKYIEAMKDLNLLLRNRFMHPFVDLVAANGDEALRLVLVERKKELVFRGVRWSDVRRLNKDPRFAESFRRVVNGKTFDLEPNTFKYTFPIPDDIVEITGMQQNPGW